MLYSQDENLFKACFIGNVSRVGELLTRGAHVNYRQPGTYVSIVSGHMMSLLRHNYIITLACRIQVLNI